MTAPVELVCTCCGQTAEWPWAAYDSRCPECYLGVYISPAELDEEREADNRDRAEAVALSPLGEYCRGCLDDDDDGGIPGYYPATSRDAQNVPVCDYHAARMTHPLLPERIGQCDLCGDENARRVVDHDHVTDLVRGLLCAGCNSNRAPSGERLRALIADLAALVVRYADATPGKCVECGGRTLKARVTCAKCVARWRWYRQGCVTVDEVKWVTRRLTYLIAPPGVPGFATYSDYVRARNAESKRRRVA